ncbi:MAG: helix-turn-helix domain-containing protein [Lachnospiraceae bacterium]|nr:helix-turn-helix domain-containing protein [Lachnospiraceae bacterium]
MVSGSEHENNTNEKRILKVPGLMEYLSIGRDQAYALMRSKTFPSTKLGNSYFVYIPELEKWLERSAGREIEL